MKNFLIPTIILAVGAMTFSKVMHAGSEKDMAKKKIRAEKEKLRTKAYLEESARSEIDFLSKKYDVEVLQDQLNKHKE